MFGIGFANPALWIGALALAAPVVIHLLSRRTPRRLVFPSIRFVHEAKASQSAIFRLRHWILFAMRMAFLLFLLLAFLKPVLQRGTLAQAADGTGSRASVIILDGSASMACAGAGFSPLARGKMAAEEIVNRLGAKDTANFIHATALPHTSFDLPTANRFQLRRDIQKVAPGLERADLDAALRAAVDQIERLPTPGKEIHLISDFQRTNWAAVDFSAVPDSISLAFVSVAGAQAGNTGVTEVMLRPPHPAVGESVEVICKIANYSPTPRTIPVHLVIGGDETQELSLDVAAGLTGSASFRLAPTRAGFLEGRVSIPEDALKADDERFFTLDVAERPQILFLNDEPDSAESRRVMLNALDPLGQSSQSPFTIRPIPTDQFDAIAGASAQVAIVCGANPLSEETAGELLEWVSEGGSLIVFMSSLADSVNLAIMQELSQSEMILPFSASAQFAGGEGSVLHLAQANFESPILKKFRDVEDLANISVLRAFRTQRNPDQGEVLLKYGDGTVAMARRSHGQGALLICNFSPDPAFSDLAKRTIFVPLLHEMVKGMRPQSGAVRSHAVGQNASATIALPPAAADLRFEDPRGQSISAGYELRQNEAAVFFGRTAASGFFRVFSGDDHLGSAAVNVDSRESNLDVLEGEQIQELARISRERFYAISALEAGALERLMEGLPLWHYCLLIALAFLAAEQALLIVWRR